MILGTSTHTGGVTLQVGQLSLDSGNSLGPGTLTVNGGTIRMNSFASSNGLTIANSISANSDVVLSGNNSAIFAGTISGVGGFASRSISGITGRLTAANTYSGTTYAANTPTFSGTTIQLEGTSGSILNSSRINVDRSSLFHVNNANASGGNNLNRVADSTEVNLRSGTLRLTGNESAASTESVGVIRSQGYSTVNVNANALQLGIVTGAGFERVNRGVTLLSGTGIGGIQGTNGVGTLVFTDNSGYVSNIVGGAGAAGTSTISINPAFIATAGTGAINSTWTTYDGGVRPLSLTTEYAAVIADGTSSSDNVRLTTASTINSATTINSLILSNVTTPSIVYGAVSGSGTLNITSGGIMSAVSTGTPPTLSVSNLNFGTREAVINVTSGGTSPFTISSSITGSGGLTKSGFGVLEMTGSVGYTGALTVNAGTVQFADQSKLGGTGTIELNGGSIRNTSATNLSRDIQVGLAHGTIDTNTSTVLTASGNISGSGGLIKQGAGTLTLTGTNTYSGITSLAAGVTEFSSSSNFGGSQIVLGPGATLRNTVATSLDKTIILAAGGGVRAIETSTSLVLTGSVIEDAAVSNALSLTKLGSGVLSLNGNGTFRGQLLVNAGEMKINGFLDQINTSLVGVSIASGAALGGSGVINRNVEFLSNSTINPGASIGTLAVEGNATFLGNSTFGLEVGSGGLDRLNVFGAIAFNGGTSTLQMFDLGGADFSSPKVFLQGNSVSGVLPTWIFDYTSAQGLSSLGLQVLQSGSTFAITAVPEPSGIVFITVASVVGYLRYRSRKRCSH